MEDVQAHIASTLDCLENLAEKSDRGTEHIQEALAQTNNKLDQLQLSTTTPANNTSSLLAALDELVKQTQHLNSIVQAMPSQNQILRRLFYRSIFRREDEVITPEGNSFEWIFDTASEQTDVRARIGPRLKIISHNEPPEESEETLRDQTSRIFVGFLRNPGCTLLFQGKAGCGKSTFMKFAARHELTESCLQSWAQTKKLVTIKVFFWQSDDPLQQSVQGFLRSILFQVLSQCPELIDAIFPHRPIGEVDAVEFRLSELEDAFDRLLNLHAEKYCFFCFFDGLDEHQGDNLSHQNLANQLVSWGSLPNVKIMCSARPYTVFLDTFRESGNVVEFHKLTRSDISNFAETKFRDSLAKPKFQESQEHCLSLVEDITESAQGIFLWAVMVVRTLINQVLDQDGSQKALRQRLKQCIERDSLDRLFDLILQRVETSPYVQMRSNMVLYLAANNPFESPLNALLFSWLDELEWFQGSCDSDTTPHPVCDQDYSSKVITPKVQRAISLLHQLTQGLLEVVDTHDPAPYFRYRVDFYHRSVRDYLRVHWQTGVRKSPFPSLAEEVKAYCRLRSLEAIRRTRRRFIDADESSGHREDADASVMSNLRSLFEYTFIWLETCSHKGSLPLNACLRAFEMALRQSEDTFPPFLLGRLLINEEVSWRYHSRNALKNASFLHWAAYWAQGEFVRAEIPDGTWSGSKPNSSASDLSLLLSSSCAADVETTRFLLSKGYRPDGQMKIFDLKPGPDMSWQEHEDDKDNWRSAPPTWESVHHDMGHQSTGLDTTTTVWLVFLRDFISNVKLYCWKRKVASSWPLHLNRDWLERLSKIIEAYLVAGADPCVFFLIYHGNPQNSYKATLYQLLDIYKPENLASFDDMLKKPWWKEIISGSGLLLRSPMYQPVTTELLLGGDWKVLGVGLENGQELLGSFKVRVF
jgi:hypothetical protein